MYQNIPHTHNTGLLPPGYYMHSPNLKNTMKSTNPSYHIDLEPVFHEHLMLHLNQRVQVATINEKLTGKLSGVAIDHLQLTVDGVDYHIRFEHVIYFKLAK
ncbi:DUF2642 domain-containing protein [Salirhabdus salicampi]|uniref:DUF2642 domain-containing protein n=1 Tax=Salirhabdus salicampi TaxID=476102 RepID=UPI0020C4B513|nr:DUF2642 domain-containing protein [Salirhabdus salicampi]MCP8615399.1 YuzF family protein [Salirhabdus salicampi]